MSLLSTLFAFGACFSLDSAALGSDDVEARRMPWVHEEVHHRNPQDFGGGTFVRGEVGASTGVRLSPIEQPQGREDDGSAVYESAVIASKQPFQQMLASWNVELPTGSGIWVDVRVGRKSDDVWTDWLRIGEWGRGQPDWQATTECEFGRIDVDYFKSEQSFDLAQYRITAWRGEANAPQIKVARVDLTFSSRDAVPSQPPSKVEIPPSSWKVRMPVPFRSQRVVDPKLASRLCSPTSVAMVMEFQGVKRSTDEISKRLYDADHDLYGNWTRAIQGAYSYGVSGYVTRCADWHAVERSIAVGQPLVISIAAEKGDLPGAPYVETAGHLLVVTGFDADGSVFVNDPAAVAEFEGVRTYSRDALAKCWLARGGTAYVFLSKR
ncbi:MAG: C39 family peptidase [Planctomycetes bacterium]|nr:C39 family peptidase [Planctomycetota bacterium]